MALRNMDVMECMKNTLYLVKIDALLDQVVEEKDFSDHGPGLWLSDKSMEMLRKLTTSAAGLPGGGERPQNLFDLVNLRRDPYDLSSDNVPYERLRWRIAHHLGLGRYSEQPVVQTWREGHFKIEEWMRQLVPELESLLYYLGQIEYLDPVYVRTVDERRKLEAETAA